MVTCAAWRCESTASWLQRGNSFGQTQIPTTLSNVVAIACGFYHSLALKADGTVVAWGTSTNPAVASGTDTVSYGQAVVPAGLSNVVAIAGGGWHCLALKVDGTLTGWGRDDYGQANIPSGISNVMAIAAGAAYSMYSGESNGTVAAWGDNALRADQYSFRIKQCHLHRFRRLAWTGAEEQRYGGGLGRWYWFEHERGLWAERGSRQSDQCVGDCRRISEQFCGGRHRPRPVTQVRATHLITAA